jgi:hypothetical protein
VTPPVIDPETVQLVAQCLNHYDTAGHRVTTGPEEIDILLGQALQVNYLEVLPSELLAEEILNS